MTDQPAPPEPAAPFSILTDFAPVPRRFNRGDVWTGEVQRAFIEALADCGSVEGACRMVGRSPASAYRLRRHPLGAEFAAAWQAAVDFGIQRIEDYAMDRASNGVEVPVFLNGGSIVMRRAYNDQLSMFMLRNRLPERYCAGGARGLSAIDQRRLADLKKQWRAEWEREKWALSAEKDKETFDSIDRMLEKMRNNRLAHMSPAQRERQIAADAQAKADQAAGWCSGRAYREYAEEAAKLLPRFIAETEADWPELPSWAWDEPDEEACPERSRGEAEADDVPALPPPPEKAKEEPEAPSGPRIRSTKDEGW